MDLLTIFVIAGAAVLVTWSFVEPRTKRGKERRAMYTQAAERQIQQLREQGIELVPAKQKMMQMWVMALAIAPVGFLMQTLLFGALWDSGLWPLFLPASLGFGFVISAISITVANQAEQAGRSWIAFFWLSALISPLITWLVVATLKPLGKGDLAGKPSAPSLEKKLRELSELLEKGLITQSEFDQKKASLLREM